MYPASINFSKVSSDNPSMFIAFLETNNEYNLTCFAGHCLFGQYKVFTPLSFFISVLSPHAGQISGITHLPDLVTFSEI